MKHIKFSNPLVTCFVIFSFFLGFIPQLPGYARTPVPARGLIARPQSSLAGPVTSAMPGPARAVNPSVVPEGLSSGEWENIQQLIHQNEYLLAWKESSSTYTAHNYANGLQLAFGSDGVQVQSSDPSENWNWSMVLTGYGAVGAVRPLADVPVLAVDANRVEYRWGEAFTGWYINDEKGLEQGFTIAAPPTMRQNKDPLAKTNPSQIVLEMDLQTNLTPHLAADGQSITFRLPTRSGWQAGSAILGYDNLKVTDADGRQLPAFMQVSRCKSNAACNLQILFDTASASYPITVDPLIYSQVKKLTALDAEDNDWFGYSIAMSGDVIVVGAPYEDGGGSSRGAAYVFTRNQGGGDNWGQVKKLTASDAENDDLFGYSVGISGDTIVVGAIYEDSGGTSSGAAYVFQRNQGGVDNWGQVKKLVASNADISDYFGWSVSVNDGTIVIGAREEDGNGSNRGAAYVYIRNNGGTNNWGEVKKLSASDADDGDRFGYSVSVSGDTIVAGALWEDGSGTDRGAAYVFERNRGGADNWGEVKKLMASDSEDNDEFGYSVSISNDSLVVGARFEDGSGSNRGAAYVYTRDYGGVDNWGQVKKLVAFDALNNDLFGSSVSVDGEAIVIGAYGANAAGIDNGAAYLYTRNTGGADNWGQVKKLTASDGEIGDSFGFSVAISSDFLVVGAINENGTGSMRGAAYIFSLQECAWQQTKKSTASDPENNDEFGRSVAISGDTLVVGAPYEDGVGSDRGAAYVFTRNTGGGDNWGQVKKIPAPANENSTYFGWAVAISGDIIIVGAYLEDCGGYDRGAVYIFSRNNGGANNWGQVKRLTASDAENYDYFGISVAISGDTVVIGANGEEAVGGSERGAAYVFTRNNGGAENWGQVKKLIASDAQDGDQFGISVAISSDTIVVGAYDEDGGGDDYGAAYLFTRNTGGADNWGQVKKLTASDAAGGDWFGWSVAIHDETAVVGAISEDSAAIDCGSVYVFTRNTGGTNNWGQTAKLIAFDAAENDNFGISAAISNNTIAVGAYREDGAGSDRGATYVFKACPYCLYLPLVIR